MRFDTVIRNGTVVTATDTYPSDIGIVNGRIAAIAAALPVESAAKVIDATGFFVMPGSGSQSVASQLVLRPLAPPRIASSPS